MYLVPLISFFREMVFALVQKVCGQSVIPTVYPVFVDTPTPATTPSATAGRTNLVEIINPHLGDKLKTEKTKERMKPT